MPRKYALAPLAFAKQQTTYDQYRELWNTPAVQKRYRAILSAPLAKGLQILHPIGRSAKSSKRSIALLKPEDSRKIRGKPMTAKTTVLGCTALSKNLFDLSIRIETGVPHQIRCHLSSIDRAILGDSLYGGAQASRLYLHCESIEIRDPDKSIPLLKVESKLLASLWPAPRDAS
ncbi:MAG: RNA pseudouridine synthase [Proteobacteria bacterium]|nr:MAG: RNA pseudouridine synthase [Pseudomonadota bacterium]